MNTSQTPRILGLTMEKVADFRSKPSAKNAGMYAALDRRFQVLEVVTPTLSKVDTLYNRLRHVNTNVAYWRTRTHVNTWALKQRSARAEQLLQQWDGQYDLIFQIHALTAPGIPPYRRPYVLHTDNTYMLSERHYPGWATLRNPRERDEWVQIERDIYQQAAFLFPRTEFLRASLIDDYGCDPARVIRVGAGANIVAHSIEGRRYDSQIALFVGNDFRRKGGQTLLQAWEQVRRRLPKARLLIVGTAKQPATLPEGIEWIGRVADRQVLADLYMRAAVFVLPSLYEPWGSVYLEAMGHGTPCIGTMQSGIPEVIEQDVTGLLVSPGEAAPLADALVAMLADPIRAEAMGRRSYESVLHRFTWDEVVARMAPYIEQAVLKRTTSAQASV